MEITCDPAKDAANQAKHGVSLALAAKLEWDTLQGRRDKEERGVFLVVAEM